MIRLYVLPPSPRAIKVIALNNFLGLGAQVRALDYFQADHLKPEFARLNPNKRQPVLEEDGWVLWESNAILFFLAAKAADSGVWPSAPRDQADVMRWLSWESSHWDPAWDILITERIKKQVFVTRDSGRRTEGTATEPRPADPARVAEGTGYVGELSQILDTHLASRRWVVGDRPTIADFALASWIPTAKPAGVSLENFKAIAHWYAAVASLPGWRDALTPARKA
jgi:glutathione S-transferase